MMNFITAASARTIVNGAASFDGLVEAASVAIYTAANKGYSYVDIPYEFVTDQTHLKFHTFIISKGFSGGKTTPAKTGKLVYRIRWE